MDEFGEQEVSPRKWKDILIFILIILISIISIVAYITITNTCTTEQNITGNMTQAFNDGVGTTIIKLITSTNNCAVASITMYNNTRQIVDLECVRTLLKDQNITLTT